LYCSPNIIVERTNLKKVETWTGWGKRNAWRVLVGKHDGKRFFEKGCLCRRIILNGLNGIGAENEGFIDLFNGRDKRNFLIIKGNEMHYFSSLFDKVLSMFRTGPLSIIRSVSTLYTRSRYLSC